MIRYALIVWFVVLLVILTGCGLPRFGTTSVPTQYSLDGVKRITPGLGSDNPTTWGQNSYPVNTDSHVLLRFEKLSEHTSKIDTTDKVEFQITIAETEHMASALQQLKLCPVTKSWMMLATWELAHPILGGEAWSTPGGDYDNSGCVLGTQSANSSKSIVFDMTQWFIDYPKGRGTNYGIIAVSSQLINIVGEQSGSFSPRISFHEF